MPKKSSAVKTLLVSRAEDGQKLKPFLAAKFACSMREAKALLDARRVWVNRRIVWMDRQVLRQGDTVEVLESGIVKTAYGEKKLNLEPDAPKKLRLLFESNDYLVVDKPARMLSVGENSVESIARAQFGNEETRSVHRLDRDTTGCLLLAKSAEAFDAAVALFKTHKVVKIYQAVVAGRYERDASTVKNELDGERAVSHIQRIAATKDASFLKVRLETGRTHQIRRHLSMLHHPILGDSQYGLKKARDPRIVALPRHMLHASALELPNPLLPRETIKAHSPLPADFRRCLRLFDMGK